MKKIVRIVVVLLRKLLIFTKAYNHKKGKAIIFHPVSFLVFIFIVPLAIVISLFTIDTVQEAIIDNFCFN